ncbi:MTH538 TIR-like domain (DUF1863) [Streptococcus pneumoniae]|uniref:MTH538 TIR-like domain (DUF1863) n=1 Tax=Streptococcus pneumoniae TaxID=1313 RepID=A0A4M3JUY0_STREE|nr:MTH538 TIR-like domain (DUF1863) [Streptococcus pneumoniae]VOC95669.1 MTH538 TIR-like domain (DUF1863) [Streptococcus pneumoniae]VOM11365.1 MTH538 TIR-like domain (DUF1863) [Streptococcus pneumoniae]VPU88437.1 MTH538 TIR-like domain (DUF1863) [Streptococcus pneumoniae]VQC10235.1 MTH538 TIR-like domain (DUF1863) [Streptococcus pneumoniae]
MSTHKCFISFKTHDMEFKKYIQENLAVDMIDKSLNEPIDSQDEDYIMRKIREDYLKDSTVTIHLIGSESSENNYWQNQNYIKRELQASLSDTSAGKRNGILGVVLPSMYDRIYRGEQACFTCFKNHDVVNINEDTTVKEFSYNFYLPLDNDKHVWSEEDRYCILVKWDDFKKSPNKYIDQAFDKRSSDIVKKIKVRP